VIKGLAGLLIVDDDDVARLPLPSRWGIDDIPLIIQDRRFTPDGQFFDRMNIVAVTNGYIGDTALVNGAHYPEARTARGWLRLRILNGSNARSYTLAASDDRSLHVIASDAASLKARSSSSSCRFTSASVSRYSWMGAVAAPLTS
jgi:blue copper oxidase